MPVGFRLAEAWTLPITGTGTGARALIAGLRILQPAGCRLLLLHQQIPGLFHIPVSKNFLAAIDLSYWGVISKCTLFALRTLLEISATQDCMSSEPPVYGLLIDASFCLRTFVNRFLLKDGQCTRGTATETRCKQGQVEERQETGPGES